MIFLKIPSSSIVEIFIDIESKKPFSYAPEFGTQQAKIIGYDNDFAEGIIGKGKYDFEKAKNLIDNWVMFPSEWTKIIPNNQAISVGKSIAIFARFGGVWWRNACRIVYVIDEKNRYGFAYGTLPAHIERGEELFLIEMDEQENVIYKIKAFSQPRHILAKIAYPIMRLLQAKFRKDSIAQMKTSMNFNS